MLAQTDIFTISQLNSWAKEWRRRIRMFSNEWASCTHKRTHTHTKSIHTHTWERTSNSHFDEKFRLFVIDSPFIVPFQLCTRLSHSLQIIRLSFARACVYVCLFCLFGWCFFSSHSLLNFWQKKKSFGMLAVRRKWVLLDAHVHVHVYVCGWCFFQVLFYTYEINVHSFRSRRFHHF